MKKGLPRSAALVFLVALFARSSTAQNFTENLRKYPFGPGQKSAVIPSSRAFRVTLRRISNNKETPLSRAAGGRFFIIMQNYKVALLSDGRSIQRVRGMVRYSPAGGVIGGYRTVVASADKYVKTLEIEVSPGAAAAVPVPAAVIQAALKERESDLQNLEAHPAGFPRPPRGTPVASAKVLDVPEAEVNLVTVARNAKLSKMARSSIWFVLQGKGSLSVGGKTYPLRANSLLTLPPTVDAVTIAPAARGALAAAGAAASGAAPAGGPGPRRIRILLIQHKTL